MTRYNARRMLSDPGPHGSGARGRLAVRGRPAFSGSGAKPRLGQPLDNSGCGANRTNSVGASKLVLPNPDHLPLGCPEFTVDSTIPGTVLTQLLAPKAAAGDRHGCTAWAAMPEASIHKEGDPSTGEGEVRPPWNTLLMNLPAPVAHPRKKTAHPLFSRPVPGTAYSGHHARPCFPIRDIGHDTSLEQLCWTRDAR